MFSLFISTGGLITSPAKIASALSNNTLAFFAAPLAEAWPWGGEGRWTSGGAKLYPERWLGLLGRQDREPAEEGERSRAKQSIAASGAAAWMFGVGAFVLVLAVVHAVLCCSWSRPRREECLEPSSGEHPWAKKASPAEEPSGSSADRKPKVANLAPRSKKLARPGSPASPGSCGVLATGTDGAFDASPSEVPENCKFQCVLYIPRVVCHRRQNMTVSINRLSVPGGTALYKAHVAEGDSADTSGAGIHLEMLGGEQEFTFLSTDDVWASQGKRQPEMEITQTSGAKYATIKKIDPATYTMARGTDTLMVFSGRFSRHDVQVRCAKGQTVARVSPSSTENKYEVVVYTNTNAGLIILGLLAIDKVEVAPT